MKVFSEKRYRESIYDLSPNRREHFEVNQSMIDNCKGREYELGKVVGRDGFEYQVSLTWTEEVEENDTEAI